MRLFWPTVDMLIETPTWTPPLGLRLPPDAFPSLGALPEGEASLDTDSLEATGLGEVGGVFQQAPNEPEIALFVFDGGVCSANLTVSGSRPAALLFRGAASLGGCIDARAAGAWAGGAGLGGWPGGGGGLGGAGGGSGGSGTGGSSGGVREAFLPGSGGQSGASAGGLGGGALQIGASGSLQLRDVHILVDGFDGRPAVRDTAGGGGSGGALVLHGHSVRLDSSTVISVQGGAGGAGSHGAHGGGGGGGGIVLGVTTGSGSFDPNGAWFRATGGPGGDADPLGRLGAAGEPGVVFLSAKQPARPAPFFSRPRSGRELRHAPGGR